MSWQVEWSERAITDLRWLPARDAKRVIEAVERYAQSGHGDIRKIRGRDALFRLRIGTWRVLFTPDVDSRRIYVLTVRHRREAYRDM
ncbi:MAG TPA: type II toxin-antitoxin system RelE/ParE family toxin [Dehalococcoidia bacterium]|nr:type II toxin-antitoxin system RelE/ParE family toxin [Dehalococcoidia bacterium]